MGCYHYWIAVLLVLLGNYSLLRARPVKGGNNVVKDFAVEDINFNKEILDLTSNTSKAQINGCEKALTTKARKITISTQKKQSKSRKTAAVEVSSGRKRKTNDIKSGFMAFTLDYHSPKQHPPRNN